MDEPEDKAATVRRWRRERPDLYKISQGDTSRTEVEKLSPRDAFMVGAMLGDRLITQPHK